MGVKFLIWFLVGVKNEPERPKKFAVIYHVFVIFYWKKKMGRDENVKITVWSPEIIT